MFFEVIPGTAAGVVIAAVMNSLCCRVIVELGPPLPITNTLRTVLLTVQFFVALSYRYGYFPAVTACARVFFPPPLGGNVPFSPIPSMLD